MASWLWDFTWCRILHHLHANVYCKLCMYFNIELANWLQDCTGMTDKHLHIKVEHQRGCQLNFAGKRSINRCNWNLYCFSQRNPVAKFLIILPSHWCQVEGRKISAEFLNKSQLLFWLLTAHNEAKTDSKMKRNCKMYFVF